MNKKIGDEILPFLEKINTTYFVHFPMILGPSTFTFKVNQNDEALLMF